MVIFNWEVRPTELRIIEPVGKDRNGIPEGSGLKEKQMYEIEIRISKSDISVYGDGEKRGEAKGDFSTAEGEVVPTPRLRVATTVGPD